MGTTSVLYGAPSSGMKGYLTHPSKTNAELLAKLDKDGFNTLILDISSDKEAEKCRVILDTFGKTDFEIFFWMEVGRDPMAATIFPDWMHRPHKIEHYNFQKVVVYPWVSVNNKAVFDYEMNRVETHVKLAGTSGVRGIFLNDLQGAPEGCGCGNKVCRMWDGSKGEKWSGDFMFYERPVATRKFVESVQDVFPGMEAIPVITAECEAGMTVAGVKDPEITLGYGRILCVNPGGTYAFPTFIATLKTVPRVAMLALYKLFDRNNPAYGEEAAWVGGLIGRYRENDADKPLIAVLQGWDVDEKEIESQINQAIKNGATGFVVASEPIDQTWTIKPEKKVSGIPL